MKVIHALVFVGGAAAAIVLGGFLLVGAVVWLAGSSRVRRNRDAVFSWSIHAE